MPYHEYPYSVYYHDIDKLCGACHACGLRLVVQGDYLRLVDGKGNVLSNVQVSYAEKCLTDKDGKMIEAYIFNVSEDGTHLVFTRGDGTYKTITVPYSEKAAKDLQNKDILDYVYGVSVSGNKLRITNGDATIYEITVPYAIQASETQDGKEIDTFACSLEVDGHELVLRDAKNRQLSRITAAYALEAGLAAEATHALDSDHADEADHALDSDHADEADHATVATDATNAIEQITISGDQMIFTTFGGNSFAITCPYSLRALNDDLSNKISETYVSSVTNDVNTGKLQFWNASGALIAELLPTVSKATYDSYDNLIADYVKTIVVDNQSDYVTVTTGKGVSTTLKINYAEHAYMDTNNQVIKNYYISWLTCVEDVDDGHYKIVMWNGDIPRAEIGRFEVWAYKAQVDVNERALTSYIGNVLVDEDDDTKIDVLDGENNPVNVILGQVSTTPTGTVSASASGTAVTLTSGTLPSLVYNSNDESLTFSAGTFPAVDTVTDPSISATFTGDSATDDVHFTDSL